MQGFGDVRRGQCSLAAASVTREFAADVLLTTTELQCDGHKVTLYGYGRAAQVLNFHNIIGLLLESDLEDVESAVNVRWGWLPFYKQERLRLSLVRMIKSEAHQIICKSKEERAKLIADGTASAEYCSRTLKVLTKGMGRLYRSASLILILALVAVVLPIEVALLYNPPLEPGVILIVAILAGAIAAGGDRIIQKRVTSVFPQDEQGGASALLNATGAIRRSRIALVIVLAVLVFGLPVLGLF